MCDAVRRMSDPRSVARNIAVVITIVLPIQDRQLCTSQPFRIRNHQDFPTLFASTHVQLRRRTMLFSNDNNNNNNNNNHPSTTSI